MTDPDFDDDIHACEIVHNGNLITCYGIMGKMELITHFPSGSFSIQVNFCPLCGCEAKHKVLERVQNYMSKL